LKLESARDSKFRWAFFVGDSGYGIHGGVKLEAKRFDNKNEVERPLYGIYDNLYSPERPLFFEKNNRGFLMNEALIITRDKHPQNPKRFATTLGGVHGYSTEAFARDIINNLERLKDIVGDTPCYQVYVPVKLKHQNMFTVGELDWKNVDKYIIQND